MTVAAAFLVGCDTSTSVDRVASRPIENVSARRVTFSKDVAPILFEHCAACHRSGGVAPFSLLTYQDATKRERQILEVIEVGLMPPWPPDPGGIEFVDERRLSDVQKETLHQWVNDGAAEGDPRDLPLQPTWPDGWHSGIPDLVLELAEAFRLRSEGTDVFRNFVLPVDVSETRYVKSIELQPRNKQLVHHAIMMVDHTQATRAIDAADPLPGFGGMEQGFAELPDGRFVGWTPGKQPDPPAASSMWQIRPGTDIVLQLHLVPGGAEADIKPRIGIIFGEKPAKDYPTYGLHLTADHLIDIPPGNSNFTVRESFVLPVAAQLQLIYPHAHLLGKEVHAFAQFPNGTQQDLLRISDWNFYWQQSYRCLRPVHLPEGTVLHLHWTFDNSSANPRNSNNPLKRVVAGNRTTDEMAQMLFQLGLQKRSDVAQITIAKMRHELQKSPDDWKFHCRLGVALQGTNNHAEAAQHYRRSIELNPDFAIAHFNLGLALESLGDGQQSVWHIRRAIELSADHPLLLRKYGALLRHAGKLDEAARHLSRAVELDENSALTHSDLALTLQLQRRDEEAIRHFRKAIDLKPSLIDATNNLAWILAASKNETLRAPDEALRLARRAVTLSDNSRPAVLDTLSVAYAATGDFEKAREVAERTLRLAETSGDQSMARQIRARIELFERDLPYRDP